MKYKIPPIADAVAPNEINTKLNPMTNAKP